MPLKAGVSAEIRRMDNYRASFCGLEKIAKRRAAKHLIGGVEAAKKAKAVKAAKANFSALRRATPTLPELSAPTLNPSAVLRRQLGLPDLADVRGGLKGVWANRHTLQQLLKDHAADSLAQVLNHIKGAAKKVSIKYEDISNAAKQAYGKGRATLGDFYLRDVQLPLKARTGKALNAARKQLLDAVAEFRKLSKQHDAKFIPRTDVEKAGAKVQKAVGEAQAAKQADAAIKTDIKNHTLPESSDLVKSFFQNSFGLELRQALKSLPRKSWDAFKADPLTPTVLAGAAALPLIPGGGEDADPRTTAAKTTKDTKSEKTETATGSAADTDKKEQTSDKPYRHSELLYGAGGALAAGLAAYGLSDKNRLRNAILAAVIGGAAGAGGAYGLNKYQS